MLQISTLKTHQYKQFLQALYLEDWDVEEIPLRYLYEEFSDDFFIATLNSKTVGFIVALKYGAKFGFISNFVVLKPFRSLGYGDTLFGFALEHLNDVQIALDCELIQEKLYNKYNFTRYFSSTHYKYTLQEKPSQTLLDSANTTSKYNKDLVFNYNAERIFTKYATYLDTLIQHQDTQFKAIYEKNKLLAYGLSFAYTDGYKFVLSASTIEDVSKLFFSLIKEYPLQTSIYIEVPDTEKALIQLAELLHMKESSTMQRMYNKLLK